MKHLMLALALTTLLAAVAPAATATTGTITRAYATPDWTKGDLAGAATWTDCNTPGCSWTPYATVQPATPDYRCLGDEFFDSDPNTREVWGGGQRTTNGSASFDLPSVSILTGVYGQRLCLMAIEKVRIQDPVCLVQYPVLGLDPSTCPMVDRLVDRVLATALLSVLAPAVVSPAPPSQPQMMVPPTPSQEPRLANRKATTHAKAKLAKQFGKRWRKGKKRTVNCARESATKLRCKASWRYSGERMKATVVVTRAASGSIRAKLL